MSRKRTKTENPELARRIMRDWKVISREDLIYNPCKYAQGSLSNKQKEILEELSEQLQQNEGDESQQAQKITELMHEAIKAGLSNHPLMQEWINTRQALGDSDSLRPVKDYISTKTTKPLSKDEMNFIAEIIQLAEKHNGNKEKTRRELQEMENWSDPVFPERKKAAFDSAIKDRRNFLRMIKKLDLDCYFDE